MNEEKSRLVWLLLLLSQARISTDILSQENMVYIVLICFFNDYYYLFCLFVLYLSYHFGELKLIL